MGEPSIVGREPELAALAVWLDQVASGDGVVALVTGEPGIGKTRFLEGATARAQDQGFAVAWGRAWEVSSGPPYWPWIEALRGLLARPHGRDGADTLLRLLPELDGAWGAPLGDPFPLYDALAGYLRAASAREPVLIVLDDLHAADPSTLRLAELVAPQLRGIRAALLGSYRDVEARLSPATDSALARLGRRGETVPLLRLDVAAVGELVRAATGRADPETARRIHSASDGNPLFVRELLKLLASRGGASGDVPAGVRTVVRERLALLAPATVALLQAAAVVGRTFAVILAAEVADATAGAFEDAIGEAAAADVVSLVEPGHYRFSHALVAETLASTLAPPIRAKLHRRAAETLTRLHADDPLAPLAEIAHHWLSVGVEAAPEALAATERAATAAEARVAFADAAVLYESALAVLANHAPGDARRRAEYLIRRAENLVRDGDRERAKSECTMACEVASSLGDGALYARAALAYGADVVAALVDPTLIHMLERAVVLLPPGDNPWRAQVMARLAAARQPSGDTREHVALAHEAIAMARRLDDADLLYEVLFHAIGALTAFERPERRAPLNAEVVRMAAAKGDRARQLRSLERLAFDMIDLGDLVGFERTVTEYEVIGAATGQPRYFWVPLLFRSMRAHWEGRPDDERRLADEAFAIREQLGESVATLRKARRLLGGCVTYEDLESLPMVMTGGNVAAARVIRAWAYAISGRKDEARAELDRLSSPKLGTPIYLVLYVANMLARVAWELRDHDLAARVYDRLEVEHGRPAMFTSYGFVLTGAYDHELMRMAALLGRTDDVERYFTSALALCDALGAAPLAREVRDDHAAILAELGRPTMLRAARRTDDPITVTPEGEFWTVRRGGELCRIKDSRGMQMLARLIANPRQQLHALDLAGAEVVDGGDAGELLDDTARARYRQRVRELQQDLAEAEAWNDASRRERIEAEIEALTAQLSSAFGLGNRQRRSGGAAERARQNVRRRLADAMQRIAASCPSLGRHLERSIRTGTTCIYDPEA